MKKLKLNSPEFINIVGLGDADLKVVLRIIDNQTLEQALALAPPIALERVKACLSIRAGILLEDALEAKPVDIDSAWCAQLRMVDIVEEVKKQKEPSPFYSIEKMQKIEHAVGFLFSELAVKIAEHDLGPHKEHLYALKLAVLQHLISCPFPNNPEAGREETIRVTLGYLQGSIDHSDISQGLKSNAEEILAILLDLLPMSEQAA